MYFTEEHNSFRESFRDFLKKEVTPHIDKWEKTGSIERFIWKKFGEMGYLASKYMTILSYLSIGNPSIFFNSSIDCNSATSSLNSKIFLHNS